MQMTRIMKSNPDNGRKRKRSPLHHKPLMKKMMKRRERLTLRHTKSNLKLRWRPKSNWNALRNRI